MAHCIYQEVTSYLPKKNVFLSLKIVFALANGVVPDEIMQHFILIFSFCQKDSSRHPQCTKGQSRLTVISPLKTVFIQIR